MREVGNDEERRRLFVFDLKPIREEPFQWKVKMGDEWILDHDGEWGKFFPTHPPARQLRARHQRRCSPHDSRTWCRQATSTPSFQTADEHLAQDPNTGAINNLAFAKHLFDDEQPAEGEQSQGEQSQAGRPGPPNPPPSPPSNSKSPGMLC